MTDTMLDFTATHVRATDPIASDLAAERVSITDTEQIKEFLLGLLRTHPEGMTAFEAQIEYVDRAAKDPSFPRVQIYSINRRMSDLHREGRIEDSGRRGPASTPKTTATIWVLA